MFKHTRAAIGKTIDNLLWFFNIFTFGTQAVYIAYQIYAYATADKFKYAHLALLIASAIYFLFFTVMTFIRPNADTRKQRRKQKKTIKKTRKLAKKIYAYLKYVINAFILSMSMYNIITAPSSVHPLSILVTVFLTLLLIVEVAFEIAIALIKAKYKAFLESLKQDFTEATHIDKIKGFFGKSRKAKEDSEPAPKNDKNAVIVYDESEPKKGGKLSDIKGWFGKRFGKRKDEAAPAFKNIEESEAEPLDTEEVVEASNESKAPEISDNKETLKNKMSNLFGSVKNRFKKPDGKDAEGSSDITDASVKEKDEKEEKV